MGAFSCGACLHVYQAAGEETPFRLSTGRPQPGATGKIKVVIVELLPPETGRGYEAMRALRPHLAGQQAFVDQVDLVQRPAGYRLVAVVAESGAVEAVAGFRVTDNLAWGHHVYVDDLSTLPHARGKGHAAALLSWLVDEAARTECVAMHLDSGVGENRLDAHRLYLNDGYRISSHHFSKDL